MLLLLRRAVVVGWLAALAAGTSAWAADEPARAAREAAVRASLQSIDETIKRAGGSWEAWAEGLAPMRQDLQRIVKEEKWPWPAKHDFRFQGKSVDLLLRDTLDEWRPFEAIVHWDRQLKARGIDLIVMPIPSKLAVYPEYLSAKTPQDRIVELSTKRLLRRLLDSDVEAVDLHTLYRNHRQQKGDDPPLYYDRDSHWRNLATQLAGEELAARLKRYDFVQAAEAKNPYRAKPGSRDDGLKSDNLRVVFEESSGRVYNDVAQSPIVLTGDSHVMYNDGRGAALTAQVALHIGLPLTRLSTEGLGPDMPVEMARLDKNGYLKGRKVVIWTFTERSLPRSAGQVWPVVDLPRTPHAPREDDPASGPNAKPNLTAEREGYKMQARGKIADLGSPPSPTATYAHYVMRFYVTDMVDAQGKKIGNGDGVVRILAMRHHKILPIAKAAKGEILTMKLTAWNDVRAKYERIRSDALADVDLELTKDAYWAELPGQPELDEKDLSVIGEDSAPRKDAPPNGK